MNARVVLDVDGNGLQEGQTVSTILGPATVSSFGHFPAFSKTTKVEQAAGKRATHLVYYTRADRPFLDAIWADSAEQAEATFLGLAEEVGWRDVIVTRVEWRDADYFVVETCHEGSDWCVRRATQAEIAAPDEETLPLTEALEFGHETARKFGSNLYDFSDDPAPDEALADALADAASKDEV